MMHPAHPAPVSDPSKASRRGQPQANALRQAQPPSASQKLNSLSKRPSDATGGESSHRPAKRVRSIGNGTGRDIQSPPQLVISVEQPSSARPRHSDPSSSQLESQTHPPTSASMSPRSLHAKPQTLTVTATASTIPKDSPLTPSRKVTSLKRALSVISLSSESESSPSKPEPPPGQGKRVTKSGDTRSGVIDLSSDPPSPTQSHIVAGPSRLPLTQSGDRDNPIDLSVDFPGQPRINTGGHASHFPQPAITRSSPNSSAPSHAKPVPDTRAAATPPIQPASAHLPSSIPNPNSPRPPRSTLSPAHALDQLSCPFGCQTRFNDHQGFYGHLLQTHAKAVRCPIPGCLHDATGGSLVGHIIKDHTTTLDSFSDARAGKGHSTHIKNSSPIHMKAAASSSAIVPSQKENASIRANAKSSYDILDAAQQKTPTSGRRRDPLSPRKLSASDASHYPLSSASPSRSPIHTSRSDVFSAPGLIPRQAKMLHTPSGAPIPAQQLRRAGVHSTQLLDALTLSTSTSSGSSTAHSARHPPNVRPVSTSAKSGPSPLPTSIPPKPQATPDPALQQSTKRAYKILERYLAEAKRWVEQVEAILAKHADKQGVNFLLAVVDDMLVILELDPLSDEMKDHIRTWTSKQKIS
ncbi:hypothetical protein DL93DRAFT_776675 [Clavulina sp. PMI_390]|nr:hypothetical protein DL93DRAFT_776675 [Clavulina sp. PMI_390]